MFLRRWSGYYFARPSPKSIKIYLSELKQMHKADRILQSAIQAFQRGDPVLVYDFEDRESEIDIIQPVENIDTHSIKKLRGISNNTLTAIVPQEFATQVGLVSLIGIFNAVLESFPLLTRLVNQNHERMPNFSLPIDHVASLSGLTYKDMALTLSSLAQVYKELNKANHIDGTNIFAQAFKMPGHLPLIISAKGLLDVRQGHSELGMVLAFGAFITPILVSSELLDIESGATLGIEDAVKISKKENIPLVYGKDIMTFWHDMRQKNE